jgi:DNA-binding transcriptional ArsR family regulator
MSQVIARASSAVRARFFRSLADPARLDILDALRDGELTAGQVALAAGLSASNASRHLACLRECGLVEARQDWRHVHYRLAGDHIEHLLLETDCVLNVIAASVASCTRPEMDGAGA